MNTDVNEIECTCVDWM